MTLLVKTENATRNNEIITKLIGECEREVQHAIHEVDNPALSAVSCSPDYLRSLTAPCLEALASASAPGHAHPADLAVASSRIAHRLSTFLLQGRATSNTSPDVNFGERKYPVWYSCPHTKHSLFHKGMAVACKELGESVLTVLASLKSDTSAQSPIDTASNKLKAITQLSEEISGSLRGESADKLADMIDAELSAMDKAIEEAAKCIQDMLSKSRADDSGIKLEVNGKILDSCTTLMQAIRALVQKARLLQGEIVSQGKGTAGAKEFYKRNHRWTDGFISAAKAVAVAAKFFL